MQQIKVWNSTLFYYYKSLYGCTEIQHGGYSLLKDGLSTPCTLHTTQRYRNTTWWIQPAQRRALSTQCTLHTTKTYRNTTWRIQPAQRRALDTMYTAHNTEIQKYNMVDTACSKTDSRHHVHCTQHRDTEIQRGGYSLLKDGLSTPCTSMSTKSDSKTTAHHAWQTSTPGGPSHPCTPKVTVKQHSTSWQTSTQGGPSHPRVPEVTAKQHSTSWQTSTQDEPSHP